MKRLFTSFVLIALTINFFAQPPQKMSYQAVIRISSGQLVTNHAVGMKVSILQGSASGTVVYAETYSPTPQTNANGLVTVEIGSGSPSTGTFSSINWANGPYFLKTETDPSGGTGYTIVGTSQLLSVPYALFAGNGSLWSQSGSNIYFNSGKVGFGISNPATYIHAYGSPVTSRGQLSLSSPAGQGTFISFYEENTFKAYLWYDVTDQDLRLQNFTSGDLNLNPYGGKVGIGTNTPGYTLDVAGNINFTGALTQNGSPFAFSWANISEKPTTITGYGITDAVTIGGDQTITGIKTFTKDITVNGLTVGKGTSSISNNTALGYKALGSNTTGNKNTAIGDSVLIVNNTGDLNTAAGYQALGSNTTGDDNTASGYRALYKNSTGWNNTAFGCAALENNLTAPANTAVGYIALRYNTTGHDNTGIGAAALFLNSTGSRNVAVGTNALGYNSSGSGNTAIGFNALYKNTTGRKNTSAGDSSLFSNTTGYQNTATGWRALYSNTTGYNNTALGSEALYSNNASFNTGLGIRALYYCQAGSYNTAVGYGAMAGGSTGPGHHNTSIGNEAMGKIAGGHNNTSAGSISLQSLTTGSGNTAMGYSALNFTTAGAHNTGIGVNAGNNNITGNDNTCIGYFANVASNNLSNATAIGYNASVNASNKIVIGNASATTVGGYGTWANYSDRRLKENINYENTLGLNFITKLKPVTFNYIDDTNKYKREGLIAQDVEQILNELGLEFNGLIIDDDQQKTMNLSYPAFIIPLITAVQEQQKQIDELKQLVKSLMQK